jgi:hypothetical protein
LALVDLQHFPLLPVGVQDFPFASTNFLHIPLPPIAFLPLPLPSSISDRLENFLISSYLISDPSLVLDHHFPSSLMPLYFCLYIPEPLLPPLSVHVLKAIGTT